MVVMRGSATALEAAKATAFLSAAFQSAIVPCWVADWPKHQYVRAIKGIAEVNGTWSGTTGFQSNFRATTAAMRIIDRRTGGGCTLVWFSLHRPTIVETWGKADRAVRCAVSPKFWADAVQRSNRRWLYSLRQHRAAAK